MIVTIAGTMFELVQALNDGAEQLKKRTTNSISLDAGCELFIAFVTLFPHESDVSKLLSWPHFSAPLMTIGVRVLPG